MAQGKTLEPFIYGCNKYYLILRNTICLNQVYNQLSIVVLATSNLGREGNGTTTNSIENNLNRTTICNELVGLRNLINDV